MAGTVSCWRPDRGNGLQRDLARARPKRLSAEPGRSRSRPASRYGSLRASAAVVFCPVEDGCQGRRLRMVLGRLPRDGSDQGCGPCEAPGVAKDRGLLGGLGADLGRPLWLSLARWAGLRFCRQPAFGAALPRRAKKTPVVFTGAWFLGKIRGRTGGLTGLVRGHSPRS